MPLSMYDASVPMFIRQFDALSAILGKAEAYAAEQGIDPAELIEARLAPDMYPLPRQIQIASDVTKFGVARLAGLDAPSFTDEETSFADLHERIAKTVAFLKTVPSDSMDGSEERDIVMKARDRTFEFKGQPYLLHFVIPNFQFHLSIAYAILRHKGVPIGKIDFLGGI